MTKDNKTEAEKMREEHISNAKKSLEDRVYQTVAGANHLKSQPFLYGQLGLSAGENAYNGFYGAEKLKKMRDEMFSQELEQGKRLGVYGEPIYPTNYEISKRIMSQIEEHKTVIPLKDLADIVKKTGQGFEFSVPDQFKGAIPFEILSRASQGAKLNEIEQDALGIYQLLSQAYDRSVSLKTGKDGYFSDLNEIGRQISEKYKKPEKKK